jgi:hypothetical protein
VSERGGEEGGGDGGGVGVVGEERESGGGGGGGGVGVRYLDELREGDDLASFKVFLYSLCFRFFSFRFRSFLICFVCSFFLC